MSKSQNGAQLLVRNLEAQGVEYVFAIPGAKIDPVFDALRDSAIKTIVCRHEQNAAFIAGVVGDEPCALRAGVFLDVPAGVRAVWPQAPELGQVEHLAQ